MKDNKLSLNIAIPFFSKKGDPGSNMQLVEDTNYYKKIKKHGGRNSKYWS